MVVQGSKSKLHIMWIVSASALTAGWCTWLCIIWSIKANGSEADCHSLWNTAWFTCLRLSFCSHMHTLGFCLIDVCVHSCTISGSFPIVNLRELLWQYFLQMSFSSTIISIKALMGDSSWNGGEVCWHDGSRTLRSDHCSVANYMLHWNLCCFTILRSFLQC